MRFIIDHLLIFNWSGCHTKSICFSPFSTHRELRQADSDSTTFNLCSVNEKFLSNWNDHLSCEWREHDFSFFLRALFVIHQFWLGEANTIKCLQIKFVCCWCCCLFIGLSHEFSRESHNNVLSDKPETP